MADVPEAVKNIAVKWARKYTDEEKESQLEMGRKNGFEMPTPERIAEWEKKVYEGRYETFLRTATEIVNKEESLLPKLRDSGLFSGDNKASLAIAREILSLNGVEVTGGPPAIREALRDYIGRDRWNGYLDAGKKAIADAKKAEAEKKEAELKARAEIVREKVASGVPVEGTELMDLAKVMGEEIGIRAAAAYRDNASSISDLGYSAPRKYNPVVSPVAIYKALRRKIMGTPEQTDEEERDAIYAKLRAGERLSGYEASKAMHWLAGELTDAFPAMRTNPHSFAGTPYSDAPRLFFRKHVGWVDGNGYGIRGKPEDMKLPTGLDDPVDMYDKMRELVSNK